MPLPDLPLYGIWMRPYLLGSENRPYSPSSLFVWNYGPIFLLIKLYPFKVFGDLILRVH